ncbi:MAG TPA: sugar ABC transporter permease, partial [Lachnospiraceae bacterium]|nr:sugar ABC transporter permease [Lachnospiraceae bacterium]
MTHGNRRTKIKKDFKKNWFVYLLAVPVLAWYIIFCYGPMWGIM